MATDMRFRALQTGYRTDKTLHYRDAPDGFFERRLMGRSTDDDYDFEYRELAFPLTSRQFQEYLRYIDEVIQEIKTEVISYYWQNVAVEIQETL